MGSKVPNFTTNPLFVCFRTKLDVHPDRIESLSENLFAILRYSAKHFGHSGEVEKNRKLMSGVVLLCWILLYVIKVSIEVSYTHKNTHIY